jgi:26S proteasome regulatory subunit N3
MRSALAPYFEITAAVRSGDLGAFGSAAARWEAALRSDSTLGLVTRLRHNVIRSGLRRVALAYSRISLEDVAARLGLPSVEDTESVVAKAIR